MTCESETLTAADMRESLASLEPSHASLPMHCGCCGESYEDDEHFMLLRITLGLLPDEAVRELYRKITPASPRLRGDFDVIMQLSDLEDDVVAEKFPEGYAEKMGWV